jgi:hypothetical protein
MSCATVFILQSEVRRNHIEDDHDIPKRQLPFLCECGDIGCEKCTPMTAPEYEELASREQLALAEDHGLESL